MKFEYLGSKFDLQEIVGEGNLYKADSGKGWIISKAGMIALLQHFPDIDCTFEDLRVFNLQGNDVLTVQACAFNRSDASLPLGRSFGELSTANADPFALAYPVSTVENRARNRAVIRHLGIEGVFSEEEIKSLPFTEKPRTELPTQNTPAPSTNGKSSKETKIQEIKTLCNTIGWDDTKRIRLYNKAAGLPLDTKGEEVAKILTEEILDKAIAICNEVIDEKRK